MDGMGSLLDITSWQLFLYLQPIHHRPHHPPTPTCQNVRLAKMSAKTRHSHSLVAEVGWYLGYFTKHLWSLNMDLGKLLYTPTNWHGTWEYTTGRGKSSSKPSFSGSMLIFGGVIPKPEFMGIWGETLPLTITTHLGEFPTLVGKWSL